jgi:hypothetical protein
LLDHPLIILSLDGLATSALSCYGSSWNRTHAIDALASKSAVWDRLIAISDDPREVLRGTFASTAWTRAFRRHGTIELLTDVPAVVDGFTDTCFDRIETLDVAGRRDVPAGELVDTQLGQLIAAAVERNAQEDPWSVLWLHSGFLTSCWDAPRDLFPIDDSELDYGPSDELELLEAEQTLDEELASIQPIFPETIPPQVRLDSNSHPDLINSWMRTYGCQIRLLDVMVEVLLESLGECDPQFVLLGTSGFQLGQNGWIGNHVGPLRSPEIRLPLIVSDCGPLRIPQLTGSDVLPRLLEQLGDRDLEADTRIPLTAPANWSSSVANSLAVATTSQRSLRAITTPSWFCVRDADATEHLYLKPDDIEDFNDVGRIRTDILDHLLGQQ